MKNDRVGGWWGRWVLMGVVMAGFGLQAFGQAVPATAGAVEAAAGLSLKQIMHDGGSLMYVIAGLSFLTVALVIYFFAVLRVGQIVPSFLRRDVKEKIVAGNLDDVRRSCEQRACPLSAVVLSGMDCLRNATGVDAALLKDVMEGEGSRQSEAIQGQVQFLLDIAVIAPMVGLLGTIFGMLQAFSAVALDIASAKPVLLAAGVSKALLTTAFGLIVGIPAMGFYAYFRRRASNLVSMLEMVSSDLFVLLSSKRLP